MAWRTAHAFRVWRLCGLWIETSFCFTARLRVALGFRAEILPDEGFGRGLYVDCDVMVFYFAIEIRRGPYENA